MSLPKQRPSQIVLQSPSRDRLSPVTGKLDGNTGAPSELHGPLPLYWLQSAARLPGKALHAGIALWFAAERSGSSSIALGNIAGSSFGLDRNAKYRALGWLEGAGLITVERKPGRAPIVTLVGHQPGQTTPSEQSADL